MTDGYVRMAVYNRYGAGRHGFGLIAGMPRMDGAAALTYGHDCHNLAVCGTRSGDMALGPCGSAQCNYAYFPNGPSGTGVAVRNLEIGIGWPRNVPAPLTGKEIAR